MGFRRVAAMNALAVLIFYGSICVCAHAASATPCSAHEAQGPATSQHPEPAQNDAACGHCGSLHAEVGPGKAPAPIPTSPPHAAHTAAVPLPAFDAAHSLGVLRARRPPPGLSRPLLSLTRSLRL